MFAAQRPLVSIVTPTKDRLGLLIQTMDSVAAQTLDEWEHIVVDDGSDDGTIEEVERRASADPRVRLIRRSGEKAGASACRNIGIRAARADYILFLDSDDLLTPDCLGRRVERLARNLDADFVTFQCSFFIDEINDQSHRVDHDLGGDHLSRFLFFELPWVISGPIWRKSSLERIGLFDESLLSWQDAELHIRALTTGVCYLRFPEIDHHIRWDNSVGRVSADQRKSSRHLHAATELFEKIERMVREGPGMNWLRQRGVCSLYFFIAYLWAISGHTREALGAWGAVRSRHLATRTLHLSGASLLVARSLGLPCERAIGKWKGLMRLRTNAELVTPQ
jgi:glycosyltransferase involved in cell wall biosynthesis